MLVVNLQSWSLVEFQQKWMLVLHMTHTALLGRFKRVCVFCGSSPGNKPSYQLAAIQLGNELVERNIDLVYGGGSIGLMGLISQAVYDGGHHVLGVIPKTLMPREGTTEINGKSALATKMERLDYKCNYIAEMHDIA